MCAFACCCVNIVICAYLCMSLYEYRHLCVSLHVVVWISSFVRIFACRCLNIVICACLCMSLYYIVMCACLCMSLYEYRHVCGCLHDSFRVSVHDQIFACLYNHVCVSFHGYIYCLSVVSAFLCLIASVSHRINTFPRPDEKGKPRDIISNNQPADQRQPTTSHWLL